MEGSLPLSLGFVVVMSLLILTIVIYSTPNDRFLAVKTFLWLLVQKAVFTRQVARNTDNWVTERQANTLSRRTSSRLVIAPSGLPERPFVTDPAMTRWRHWRTVKRFWCDM